MEGGRPIALGPEGANAGALAAPPTILIPSVEATKHGPMETKNGPGGATHGGSRNAGGRKPEKQENILVAGHGQLAQRRANRLRGARRGVFAMGERARGRVDGRVGGRRRGSMWRTI
eukprot:5409971-Lingulodinium_polyedra.AAC.1